ncbi:Uncharacterised protein [Bordetella pertussis]|nr:Uncharacterised protein [Bordetella pertussis]CFW18281.1 Uncharacterised protein [Bordetella pertussis]
MPRCLTTSSASVSSLVRTRKARSTPSRITSTRRLVTSSCTDTDGQASRNSGSSGASICWAIDTGQLTTTGPAGADCNCRMASSAARADAVISWQ